MPDKFPKMVDELQQPDERESPPSYATNASTAIVIPTEPVASRPRRRNLRIYVECPRALKGRLYALSFETGLPVAEIGRHALWSVVLEAESNKEKFCAKVARERMNHLQQERL